LGDKDIVAKFNAKPVALAKTEHMVRQDAGRDVIVPPQTPGELRALLVEDSRAKPSSSRWPTSRLEQGQGHLDKVTGKCR